MKYLWPFILVVPLAVNAGGGLSRGLRFLSTEVDKDKRTMLNLTPERPFVFKGPFSVGFDLKLRRQDQNFGYVFRIAGDDTLNIDLLANLDSEAGYFSLVVGKHTVMEYTGSEVGGAVAEGWIDVLLTLDPSRGDIRLSLGGMEKSAVHDLGGVREFDIFFGANTHHAFSTTDVAPMTLRDIRIADSRGAVEKHWRLDAHADGAVYDERCGAKAAVQNPRWEIDSHINFREQARALLPGKFYGIAFDNVHDRIFAAKDGLVFVHDTRGERTDTIRVRGGRPLNTEFSQLEYDPARDELISYDVSSGELVTFDFDTARWSGDDDKAIIPMYIHHSGLWLPRDSTLVMFGGYGFHRYHALLRRYGKAAGEWDVRDLSGTISPRYLGSMGYEGGGKALYFGGFGNESGFQEESPRNYYDLYRVDVDEGTAEKVWELPDPAEHFTNSNSMVVDARGRKFYALAYANQRYASAARLHQYSLDVAEYRAVGDAIPYNFKDVDSYCDLFLNSDSTRLFAVVSHATDGDTDLRVHSIAYPPLGLSEVTQAPPPRRRAIWIAVCCLGAAALATALFRRMRTLKRRRTALPPIEDEAAADVEAIPVREIMPVEMKPLSINLLGELKIIDAGGGEIAKTFPPIVAQLFLLLYMSTAKNGNGLTSREINRVLWPDKDDANARNNRNVCINKLRSLLKAMPEISVVKIEEYWCVKCAETISCDYDRALRLMDTLQTARKLDMELLLELVEIGLRGPLLPYIQRSEWIEPWQSDFGSRMIECLMRWTKSDRVASDPRLLLRIADIIQSQDSIDEEAIRLKCRSLFQMGHKTRALQAFNRFTHDYESILAESHSLVFNDLING